MEALLLLLIVPALWVLFSPTDRLRRFGQNPLAKPAVVAVLLLAGWVVLTSLPERSHPATDYASADTELRALLD